MYDGVLRLKLPIDATIVGYADDVALVVVDKRLDILEAKCNDAAARVQRWLTNAGLELAAEKTEAVLISARWQKQQMKLRIGGHEITSQDAIKYLGVLIDTRLSFKQHLAEVSFKAEKINRALTLMMPNIGGPKTGRRRLLSTVVESVTLYAAPIWAHAKYHNMQQIARVQRRSALRVSCAYRTVSEEAIAVIAGKMPIDIRARELSRLYSTQGAAPSVEQKTAERAQATREWQQRWDTSHNGRWTYALIPNIEAWTTRPHGELDFHLTQLLSCHGCFQQYLHRFKRADSPLCPSCPNALETAEHVAFECSRFNEERRALEVSFGCVPTAENLTNKMCSASAYWNAVQSFANEVIRKLRQTEKERNEMQQQRQQHQSEQQPEHQQRATEADAADRDRRTMDRDRDSRSVDGL